MSTFTAQLGEWATKTKQRTNDVVGRVVVNISSRVDARSPVGDPTTWKHRATISDNGDLIQHGIPKGYVGGRFRGNWQLGVDAIPDGETGRIDPGGDDTLNAIIAALPASPAGHIFYITNNSPYGQALEDGHSRQAPNGMVGLTAMEFPLIVREAAA